MSKFIRHITLQTGHVRDSFAHEVGPDVLSVCTRLIDAATANEYQPISIPQFDGYTVQARATSKCLHVGVSGSGLLLLEFVVALHSRCGSSSWRHLHENAVLPTETDISECPPEPWIAVSLMPASELDLDAMQWLGDFERCMAWAFYNMRQPAQG